MAGTWSHISYNFCLAKRLKKTIWSTISTNQKVAIIIEPVCHSLFLAKHFRYLLPTTITDNTLWPRLAKLSIYVVRSILAVNEWSGNLTGTWPAVYFSTCVDSFSSFWQVTTSPTSHFFLATASLPSKFFFGHHRPSSPSVFRDLRACHTKGELSKHLRPDLASIHNYRCSHRHHSCHKHQYHP